ncbi:MAG TPA: hypothetical protein VNJ05_04245 [Sphingomicrobium sp.]|nr:hypothetical protein [Sphingomicrobium sp.]
MADRLGLHGEPMVGNSPHLDEGALAGWRELVSRSSVYLEYGSGGSTVEAAKSVDHLISVESDPRYLAAVERRVASAAGATATFHPLHADIGITTAWGRPLVERKSAARLGRWRRYSEAPWPLFERLGLVPDFIFVDGRFRVACVFESFLRLPADAECRFMLDDYEPRKDEYGAILAFAAEVKAAGRALTFRRAADFDREGCARLLRHFQADPR